VITNILDLDQEIETRENRTIAEIFEKEGEAEFRKLEEKTLKDIYNEYNGKKEPAFISLGAGYEGLIPEPSHIIWLQRPTDGDGRIFLDRPRLLPEISPYEEYLKKFADRNYKFSRMSDEHLLRLEGSLELEDSDLIFFGLKQGRIGGGLTLLPEHFKRFSSWGGFVERRIDWGVDFLELRDDLLEEGMLKVGIQEIKPEHLMLSFRSPNPTVLRQVDLNLYRWDWAMELGDSPFGPPTVLSLHRRPTAKGIELEEQIVQLQEKGKRSHLKLAVEIHTWDELDLCHQWWMEDPSGRSFLPRSKDGRWSWYRQLFGPQMRIAFFREDVGSALDQPYFSEWVRAKTLRADLGAVHFAVVLGSPVHHSRTPSEQREFFISQNQLVVPIEIKEGEDFKSAVKILKKMGMLEAAVTSPHKISAFEACDQWTKEATSMKSVNTLWATPQGFLGHNTDLEGLKVLLEDLADKKVAVWGGGGTRNVIGSVLPHAHFYSARSGKPLKESMPCDHPDVVIWAVPRSRMKESQWPLPSWKPSLVVDLNYTMDSPGREYVLNLGGVNEKLQYRSGLEMFKVQARGQRVFWDSQLNALNKKLDKGSAE
jgi:hypothetical protein